mmetsp:Transcript_90622/g.163526  ORF Transcript_90622/g.163526 Transcript_90622/m.163526 type:complete len:312 (-) Transcript_90622:519-1454(-)
MLHAHSLEVFPPRGHFADALHGAVQGLDLRARGQALGPLVAGQRAGRSSAAVAAAAGTAVNMNMRCFGHVVEEPDIEHDEPHGHHCCLEAAPKPLLADALFLGDFPQVRATLQEPQHVAVEDLAQERRSHQVPAILVRGGEETNEFAQVRHLGLHALRVAGQEAADPLLDLLLDGRRRTANRQEEVVECHVATQSLLRGPDFALHEENNLRVHQLRQHAEHDCRTERQGLLLCFRRRRLLLLRRRCSKLTSKESPELLIRLLRGPSPPLQPCLDINVLCFRLWFPHPGPVRPGLLCDPASAQKAKRRLQSW